MKTEIKYRDFRVGREIYTVKMKYLPNGSIFNGAAVVVKVMKWHTPPRNLWEKLTEFWRYELSSWTWDPQLCESSLEAYVIDKCALEADKRLCQDRGAKEWEVM